MKIACPYVGTYILFSQVHDADQPLVTVSSPTTSNQPQSDSAQHRSTQPSVLPSSVQQRPSANASSSSRSAAARHGNLRAAPHDSSFAAQPADYDSVTQQYVPVLQVLVQYVLSTYILLVYQSLTLRDLFPTVALIHVSLSEGHTLLCGSLRLHLFS